MIVVSGSRIMWITWAITVCAHTARYIYWYIVIENCLTVWLRWLTPTRQLLFAIWLHRDRLASFTCTECVNYTKNEEGGTVECCTYLANMKVHFSTREKHYVKGCRDDGAKNVRTCCSASPISCPIWCSRNCRYCKTVDEVYGGLTLYPLISGCFTYSLAVIWSRL